MAKKIEISEELKEKCLTLALEGVSAFKISELLFIGYRKCREILEQNKIPLKNREITPKDKEYIISIFTAGTRIQKIAKITGFGQARISKLLRENNIDTKFLNPLKQAEDIKKCKNCLKTKNINEFRVRKKKRKQKEENHLLYENICRNCVNEERRENYQKNKNKPIDEEKIEKRKQYSKKYYQKNKEKIKLRGQKKYQENKQKYNLAGKKYRQENKEKVNARLRRNEKERLKKDPAYKLRRRISGLIRQMLKKNGTTKLGQSILQYLPYSLEELVKHIEFLWEPWMNWDNYGVYDSNTWDDNDSSTWAWQLDHIIPQSLLSYDSMSHPNFLKCWALSNLRPLNAKINNLDGSTRVRHKIYKDMV